jgi:DNA-binding NarL/FixJ family response regulator
MTAADAGRWRPRGAPVPAGHPVDVAVVCEPGPDRDELVRSLTVCSLLRVRIGAGPAVHTGRSTKDAWPPPRPRPAVVVLRSARPARDVAAQVAAGETAPILVVSPVSAQDEIVRALQAGATSYLVEGQFDGAEVLAAALGTAAGRSHLSPSVLAAVVRRLQDPGRPAAPPELARTLSRRERQIMELVAAGHSNAAIAGREFIAEKTVRNHLNNIYAKLGVRSRAEAVLVWLGHGRPPG